MAFRQSFAADPSRYCPSRRPSRAKQAVMVRCQADFRRYKAQLASAAAPCIFALSLTLRAPWLADAAQAHELIRDDHKLTVSRSVLEKMLLQQMDSRVHTLSDEELLYLLEQAQSATFPSQLLLPGTSHVDAQDVRDNKAPFPAAEPELVPQNLSPLDSADQGKPGSAKGRMSGMPRRLKQVPAELIASDTQPLSEEPAERQKPVDSAAESVTGPAASSQQAASEATTSSADDWKFKLQAFAKPLMQQMQGPQSQPQSPSTNALADSNAAHAQAPSTVPTQPPDAFSSVQSQQQQQQQQSQAPADRQSGSQNGMLGSMPSSDASGLQQGAQSEENASTSGMRLRQQEGAGLQDDAPVSRSERQEASAQDQSAGSKVGSVNGIVMSQLPDEAADQTSTMLQSSGVALPATIADIGKRNTGRDTVDQARVGTGLSPVVLAYLGASWRRALPQLTLLAGATTASTLAVLSAQAAALRTAQALQGRSASSLPIADPSSMERPGTSSGPKPDASNAVRLDAASVIRPDAPTAISANASNSASTASSNSGGPSPFLSRLWQSAKKSLQPVLATGLQKLWRRQGKLSVTSEQEGVQPASSGESAMQGDQDRQALSTQSSWQGLQEPSHAEHDEWGRLVLHVNGSKTGVNGHSSSTYQQSQPIVAEDQANSSGGILWVRQNPVDQQDEVLPYQQTRQNGSANGAVHVRHEKGHAQHSIHSDDMPPQPRIRLRHRRFHGHEISREALLDNVE